MPSLPALSGFLTGSVARVRPAAERDIPEVLVAHQDDPSLHAALGLNRPPSGAELGRRIDAAAHTWATGTGALLTIVERHADDCVGQVDIVELDHDHRRAELRIWVAPARRGRGLGADALALTGRWLLEAAGMARVQILADPEGAAVRGPAVRAGFSEEATLRGYRRRRGRRVDVVVLSLIARDLVTA